MKILVISTSLRNNSNSDILADEFIKGVKESGHEAEKISLRGKKINFCTGCESCQNINRKCVYNDDADVIVQKMHDADVVVFAAPIYFSGNGQMQTLLDRTYPLIPLRLGIKQTHKFRDVYLITTSGGKELEYTDFMVEKVKDWIRNFNGDYIESSVQTKLAGLIRGVGVDGPGEIRKFPDTLKQAFEMGRLKPNDENL